MEYTSVPENSNRTPQNSGKTVTALKCCNIPASEDLAAKPEAAKNATGI